MSLSDGTAAIDPTALSFWFPKVADAGLPVPRTRIVKMPDSIQRTIFTHLWGEDADATEVLAFVDELRTVAAEFGAPLFLRTDHTSGKHQWSETCFVSDPAKLRSHVYAIAEDSEMAGIIGMPWNTWVVREMLPTIPFGVCPRYGNMPVCKEFRFFVDGGTVECFHPYWPRHALKSGGCDLTGAEYAALCDPGDIAALSAIASRAGQALDGRWSVDLLETERGWFLTDMAEADKSFHWEGCAASVDTHAKRGDSTQIEAPSPMGSAVPSEASADAQKGSR